MPALTWSHAIPDWLGQNDPAGFIDLECQAIRVWKLVIAGKRNL